MATTATLATGESNLQFGGHSPTSLTILPTYRCTAACPECCFESSPSVQGRLSLEQILAHIDAVATEFTSLQLVVFSGGECFLIGQDLDRAIAHASRRGLRTRCVSNGYWAISEAAAHKRVAALKAAGLDELNLSTGDEHQMFVPFERVVSAAVAASRAGLSVVVVAEGHDRARFRVNDVLNDPRLKQHLEHAPPGSGPMKIMGNIWMSFHADRALHVTSLKEGADSGCGNILDNMVITPHNQLAACCGLTMEHIPELKLGDLSAESAGTLYRRQFDDFLKVWLWVDGPKAILEFAASRDAELSSNSPLKHACETCAEVHQSRRVREVLSRHYRDVAGEVMVRYFVKRRLARAREAAVRAGV